MTQPLKNPPNFTDSNGHIELVSITKSDMKRVNEVILSRMGSDVDLIPRISEHLVNAGGKRLRPMLTLACAQMFEYKGINHILLAAAVEFMHTATLLHDDVVDESDLRRGRPTARRLFGNQASVLVGDFLLGQAFKIMVETESLHCLEILSHAAAFIAEGEVMQLSVAKSLQTTPAQYTQVCAAKTAALFSAATQVGASISSQTRDVCTLMAQYGHNLGMAFQIIDDVLDFTGDPQNLGKNIGDDLREGKVTLPIIEAFSKAQSASEISFWRRTVEEGIVEDGDITMAIDYMQASGALEVCKQQAKLYSNEAVDVLHKMPKSIQNDALAQVAQYNIERVN